ncbi:MAG TPA: hypothetical protein VJ761_08895 [Ktedonobacteraceae bacterium]|nr:hypothetical protein [Ktedonobacteraceae bacterium]
MTIDSTRHAKPLHDPTGHVGPKSPSDAPLTGPDGHVGPKLDPNGPLNLGTLTGSGNPFSLTMTNLNGTDQNWTWSASTPISSVTVTTPPGTIAAGAHETISGTVDTTGLSTGSYNPVLTFTFTPDASSTITVQFSVS